MATAPRTEYCFSVVMIMQHKLHVFVCFTISGVEPSPPPSRLASWYLGVWWTWGGLFSHHKTFPLHGETELQPCGTTSHQLHVGYSVSNQTLKIHLKELEVTFTATKVPHTRVPASQTKTNGCYCPPDHWENHQPSHFTLQIIKHIQTSSLVFPLPTITNSGLV